MAERWWRGIAIGGLAPIALVVVRYRGDGIGGDSADYIDAARNLTEPTRLPPGLPLLLAPLEMPAMVWLMTAATLALVGCMWWAAVKIGGWRSGALASALILLSPSLVIDGGVVMADRIGALTVVGAVLALLHQRPLLAGILVGVSGWMRLAHVAFMVGLPRRAWRPAGVVAGALFGWQMAAKGSLLGYSSDQASWALGHFFGEGVWYESGDNPATVANVQFFPEILLGREDWTAPSAAALAVIGLWRHRGEAARFTLVVVAVNLAVYLPYYFQSSRFMLPAACLLTIFAASAVGGSNRSEILDKDVAGERRTGIVRDGASASVS